MNNKKTVIIQARMGSTRLPGKVLMDIGGKTVLNHVVERISQCKNIDDIIIATTTLSKDDLIVKEAEKIGCKYYRGSEDNVLNRYYEAATYNRSDVIIRITSDCPLIDSKLVDEMLYFYMENNFDMVTNASPDNNNNRTYPRGLDTEIFSYNMLKKAKENATKTYQREHVTPYLYENITNIFYYKNPIDYSKYRFTLDTPEDLILIKEIYKRLYIEENNFYLEDIIKVMEKNTHLYFINNNIEQKHIRK